MSLTKKLSSFARTLPMALFLLGVSSFGCSSSNYQEVIFRNNFTYANNRVETLAQSKTKAGARELIHSSEADYSLANAFAELMNRTNETNKTNESETIEECYYSRILGSRSILPRKVYSGWHIKFNPEELKIYCEYRFSNGMFAVRPTINFKDMDGTLRAYWIKFF